MEPEEDVPLHILREITDDFSEERKLGEGTFGVVYKGVTKDGAKVAVKMLRNANLDYKQFQNEFYNLRKLKHQNIVEVLGYCYETEQKPFIMPDGSKLLVDDTYRALCLEYLNNGSLQEHLSDDFRGLDWHTRFKIIKGICYGLEYIHDELEEPIYHLDLKPDNILLDKDMVPKIADFGLSRIFAKGLSRTTQNPYGTLMYQPPEYIDKGEISEKFDIFSLGVVMIKIISGPNSYPKCLDMSSDEFIGQVQKNWRELLQATCINNSWLEAYCQQVGTCTQIALNCVHKDSQKRPDMVEITDKLNEIEIVIGKLPKKGCRRTVSGMTMHNKKIDMTKESKEILSQVESYDNFMIDPSSCELEFVDAQEITSYVVEELIVGRTEEKEKIINLLEFMSAKIVILPIYGIGGIGKTTFARMIYNDPKFKCYSKAWVYVSQRFDLNKICESIVSQLSEKESQSNERQTILSCIKKLLSGKEVLIVLDDMWEDKQFQLMELKDMLYHDHSSIIVLVTTRSERVAERICTNLQPYKILPLANDMCWDILKHRSGFDDRYDKEQLAAIGQEMAMKCCGVALAAQSLGFTLRYMNSDQWIKVNDSHIWNQSVSDADSLTNHVLASLKLSYNYMEPCLKPCFAYCAIFPKGHKIVKKDLIYQWISLDFIKPKKLLSNMQLCEKYISQLLGLSFFQRSVSPTTCYWDHKNPEEFITMHDLVHDLAELVMVDEILLRVDAYKQINPGGSRIHFELLNDCAESLNAFTQYPTNMRALRLLQSDKTVVHGESSSSSTKFLSFWVSGTIAFHADAFLVAKYLRVLDLSECYIQKLPNSIGNLKQLRYLSAPHLEHHAIPDCITELSKLIYLCISSSGKISKLPELIGEMESLVYLNLSGCGRIKKLPKSFGKLQKLVHLDLSRCSLVTDVYGSMGSLTNLEYLDLSYCNKIGFLPDNFGSLVQLRYLDLTGSSCTEGLQNAKVLVTLTNLQCLDLSPTETSWIENLPEALSRLINLNYLDLSDVQIDSYDVNGVLEGLGSLNKLQCLVLSRCFWFDHDELDLEQTSKAMENLIELHYLYLGSCSQSLEHQAFSIFLECISNIPNLEHLDLSRNDSLTSVPDCFNNLKKLHTLNLVECSNLETLPAILNEMDSLNFLYLHGCTKLKMQKQAQLNVVTLPKFLVQADWNDSSSNLTLLLNVNPDDIEIRQLENVKFVQEARSIKLKGKEIRDLTLDWTEDAERFVEEDMEVLQELVPPSTLEELRIGGYNGVRYPEWFGGAAFHFPKLVRIYLSNSPKCDSLPPLGQLPNLIELVLERMNGISRIGWDLYGSGRSPFPSLRNFYLHEMESLKVWYTTNSCSEDDGESELILPNLRMLRIVDCPNLTIETCPPRAQWWYICGSDGVVSSWGEATSWNSEGETASRISGEETASRISDGETASQISEGETTSWISDDSSPSAPPTTLHVTGCKVPMHEWRLLHHLPDLTKLTITGCSDLRSSPEIIQALSSLQSLTLEDNHRQELINCLGELTSLEYLKIEGYVVRAPPDAFPHLTRLFLSKIESMTELPQWMADLISLQQLQISLCPNLNDLPESIGRLTSLNKLGISDCDGITSLPKSIRRLCSLNTLEISNCKRITSLPESLGRLASLHKLEIMACHGITSLPDSIGHLRSLNELAIRRCNGITYLPESIKQLRKLKRLHIIDCEKLQKWCKTKKNKRKLAHIKQKIIRSSVEFDDSDG